MTTNDQLTVHWVEQALERGLAGMETLMVGNLNTRLVQPHDWCKEDLETAIANYVL